MLRLLRDFDDWLNHSDNTLAVLLVLYALFGVLFTLLSIGLHFATT